MFKTIFFVEDSEVELIAYRRVLERAGYCVVSAKDGLEAMRLLHNVVPDLILLDLVLPRFDGVEVLKFIRSHPRLKAVPVIICSTNSIIDAQDEPLLEGANKRLLKCHCTPAIMLQAIRDVMAGKTLEHPAGPESKDSKPSATPAEPVVIESHA
jgi:chemosensory pili system protein ChpA (sensor histidine kinase/response regulator)